MPVDRFTKALLLVIATCLVVLCARDWLLPARAVHGATGTYLQFTADRDRLYFYDPVSQKVYAYPAPGGRPTSVLQLDKPGGELKPAPTY